MFHQLIQIVNVAVDRGRPATRLSTQHTSRPPRGRQQHNLAVLRGKFLRQLPDQVGLARTGVPPSG